METSTREVETGAVCQSTRMLIRRKVGSTVETWPSDWRNGPDVGSHAAVQNSPSSSCCCSYTFFFIQVIWLSLFCASAVPVTSDDVLSLPSTVLNTIRDGSRSLLTWGLFSYFSGSERCYSEHLGNFGCILGWVLNLVTCRFGHWFEGKLCLYPSSLSQVWFP